MIAGLFVAYGEEFINICTQLRKEDEARECRKHIDSMVEAIKSYGWDGELFIRAYDYFGNKIGSKENEEGKIFIESQGYCIMAGVGLEDGKAKQALESVKKYLDCEYGIVLNNPAFSKYYINMEKFQHIRRDIRKMPGYFATQSLDNYM